jgi:hypothetical protein
MRPGPAGMISGDVISYVFGMLVFVLSLLCVARPPRSRLD